MRFVTGKRLGLLTALAIALAPLGYPWERSGAADKTQPKQFTGKVVPLKGLLDKFGSQLDPEAAPHWLALVADDGETYPLIPDAGGRMFFKDERLLNRPMRLSGQLYKDTHLLQVVSVRSIVNGKPHEIYYWCDICSIRRGEKASKCECCGGPMELREEPVKN